MGEARVVWCRLAFRPLRDGRVRSRARTKGTFSLAHAGPEPFLLHIRHGANGMLDLLAALVIDFLVAVFSLDLCC